MLLETSGSAAGGPKPTRGERKGRKGRVRSWMVLAQQWLVALALLPMLVVAMLIKPEWFTTSDE